eukprot:scaffold39679_cov153-Skeletonema_marinoi.AAC.2
MLVSRVVAELVSQPALSSPRKFEDRSIIQDSSTAIIIFSYSAAFQATTLSLAHVHAQLTIALLQRLDGGCF